MSVHAALFEVQKNLPTLVKTATNPHFGNEYVPLEEVLDKVLPVLHEQGLLLIQEPHSLDTGVPVLRTSLIHVESGDKIESTMALVLDKTTPQGQGSAITYARRYSILSILGLVGEDDDDGNAASPKPREVKRTARRESASSPSF